MSQSGHNLKLSPRKFGCRLLGDNSKERFTNPLLRVWCHKDKPPEGWVAVDRLGEMDRYFGYWERVEGCES